MSDIVRDNQDQRRARRFGAAFERWIGRFSLALFIAGSAGIVLRAALDEAREAAAEGWNGRSVARLAVFTAALAVLAIETAGFYAGERLWVHRAWRRVRPLAGFSGIVLLGAGVVFAKFAPAWLIQAVFGNYQLVDAWFVAGLAALYGVFNWGGFSFGKTWHAGIQRGSR